MRKCFLLLLVMLPLGALAAPAEMPYDSSLCIRYGLLTEAQQQIFDVLYDAAWRGETEVAFARPVNYDDIDPAMLVLQYDCP